MVYRVNNLPDVSYIDLAEPDAGDFAALGERNTGVTSGGTCTAIGGMQVHVDAATGEVDGTAFSSSAVNLTLVGGESNPRFDLVVVDGTGAVSVIKGTASSNPRWPYNSSNPFVVDPTLYDPSTYCVLYAVYVRTSVAALAQSDLVDKRVGSERALVRTYADGTSTVVQATDGSTGKTSKMTSDGALSWVTSKLSRTADAAMSFITSLTVQSAASDTSTSSSAIATAALALKAKVNTAAERILTVLASTGVEKGYINGLGQAYFDNYKMGIGVPEGNVVGTTGDLYVDRGGATANTLLYIKTTPSGNTGWVSMRSYVAGESALPPGIPFLYLGDPVGSPPANGIYMNGQLVSATDPLNTALYALIGNSYGGTPGTNFGVPDWRGRGGVGAGGALNLQLGQVAGIINAQVALDENHLPYHGHDVDDPGHTHPLPGFPLLWKPPAQPTALQLSPPGAVNVPYVDIWKFGFDFSAKTGIAVLPQGGGAAFSVLNPVGVGHWFVSR